MSRKPWDQTDTEALLKWTADEAINETRSGNIGNAQKLLCLVASFFDLFARTRSPGRVDRWLDWRMDQIGHPLVDRLTMGKSLTPAESQEIIYSLQILEKFSRDNNRVSSDTDDAPIPEPFDDEKVFR